MSKQRTILLAAAALAVRGLGGLSRRSRARPLSPLQLAIAYVRDSTRRSDLDRRRALSLLAETVDDGEPSLAAAAAERAWSKPPAGPSSA